MNIKIEPLFRENKLISIRVKYGYRSDHKYYIYQVEFRDSYQILKSSLKNLSDTFLADSPNLKKIDNGEIMQALMSVVKVKILKLT